MVSGNLFHFRRNSWPPEEYINRATLHLVCFYKFYLFSSLCFSATEMSICNSIFDFSLLLFFMEVILFVYCFVGLPCLCYHHQKLQNCDKVFTFFFYYSHNSSGILRKFMKLCYFMFFSWITYAINQTHLMGIRRYDSLLM